MSARPFALGPDSPIEGWGLPDGDDELLPLNVHSNAYKNLLAVKTGPGRLYGFTIYSSAAAAQFIQVHDKATPPASGDVPACVFTVAAGAVLPISWLPARVFLYGCYLVNSSTGPTYTAGAADTFFDAQFV